MKRKELLRINEELNKHYLELRMLYDNVIYENIKLKQQEHDRKLKRNQYMKEYRKKD